MTKINNYSISSVISILIIVLFCSSADAISLTLLNHGIIDRAYKQLKQKEVLE